MSRAQPVRIATAEGFELEGVLDGEGDRGVVVCHPHPAFGGTLATPLVAALAEALAAAGLRALRFNFRGIGTSGGIAAGGRAEDGDVVAACARLRALGVRDVALVGYSFGALMAGKAIARHAALGARALVAIGFPSTIVGDHADRIADVRAALTAVPSLLLSGDRDQFSELPRLRQWCVGLPHVELVELPAQGHFFAGPALDDVVARSVAFLG